MATALGGKVAVVSGGSRGIGRAIAMELAMRGCNCLLAAKTELNLRAARRQIAGASGRRVEIVSADLRTSQGCLAVRHAVEGAFGDLDILVNNAGATRGGDFLQQADEVWEDGFALKFYACVRLCRLFWRDLAKREGVIVNIVGGFARTPDPNFLIGGAVNAAMANFTKGLASRGKRDGVNVNAVYPGLTETERVQELFDGRAAQLGISVDEVRARAMKKQGLRRLGTPEDVAKLVAFLCSPDARHIQGTAIAVDGGATEDLH
jgi:NAD(P)-dependent dehydrogenase (short-subunit alcohol dehydrogenase family)